jgi:hypothetical protein
MYKTKSGRSFRLPISYRHKPFTWITVTTTALLICALLLLVTPSALTHLLNARAASPQNKQAASLSVGAHSHINAAASSIQQINIPYFTTAVPFNQTAIFWFGDVTSTDNYTDVRIGYNSSELYVDLQIVDQYLWYDPNTSAPNLNAGDNANIYLTTTSGGSSLLPQQSFKFQAAVNGYVKRSNYQQAFTGNGAAWTASSIPFTAVYGWRGHGINGPQDSGWSMTYHLPFASLGLSGPPSQGTLWKLAIQVHNRDNAANTPLPEKWWPDSPNALIPSSWGNIAFGIPTYNSPQTQSQTSYTIRNKLNNQVVTDGMVGGSLSCGNRGLNRWTQWGTRTYPAATQVNIQNESDISDWNCFSKFYITFPLSSLPAGLSVVNASITLFEYGNSGEQGVPNPSYIQVAIVGQDWNPNTLAWNTAPPVQENIGSILVNTKTKPVVPPPGVPVTWDVSLALAQAYATGQPLRLVFYSTDNQYNTGKYFWSSSVGNWNAGGRPTLQVTLGTA